MKVNQKNVIRQGDVLLCRIDELPAGLKKLDNKILQDSETQGKFHHFKQDAAVTVYQMGDEPSEAATITPDFGKFIVVDESTILYRGKGFNPAPSTDTATDHHALSIEPGIYQVRISQVYDKERQQARKNLD